MLRRFKALKIKILGCEAPELAIEGGAGRD